MPAWLWWGWDFFVVLVRRLSGCFFGAFGFHFFTFGKEVTAMQDKLEFRSLIFLECTLLGNPACCLSRNCVAHPPLNWISGLQSQVFNRPKLIFPLS